MPNVFIISLIAMVFVSCNSSGDRMAIKSDQSSPATFSTPPEQGADSNGQDNIVNTPTAPTAATPANSNAAVILNPSHGAPGHRCDIAVGQPLNESASTVVPSTTNSTPTPKISLPQIPVQPTTKTARLNPAHGAPGHDCSIAVGQPLKS